MDMNIPELYASETVRNISMVLIGAAAACVLNAYSAHEELQSMDNSTPAPTAVEIIQEVQNRNLGTGGGLALAGCGLLFGNTLLRKKFTSKEEG
jgi:hypothetical protein